MEARRFVSNALSGSHQSSYLICLAAHDVPSPGPALHEREDEQDAQGEVLERVGKPSHDRVDHGDADRCGVEPAEHDREAHEKDEDNHAGQADGGEVLEVADPHLPRLVEGHERKRDRREGGHDVDLDRPRPADHECDNVCRYRHDPADEGDDEHREERCNVVGRGYRDLGEIDLRPRPEKPGHTVDGEFRDLVDALHDGEAVLHEEEEHREEHEEEHDLLHARHRRVAVYLLAYPDELDGEDEGQHAAPDGQDRDLPDAVHDVVHGDGSGAAEHLREARRKHAVGADRLEHVYLAVEDPVARVAEYVAEPCVDVVGYGGEREAGQPEEHHRQSESEGERVCEALALDGFADGNHDAPTRLP